MKNKRVYCSYTAKGVVLLKSIVDVKWYTVNSYVGKVPTIALGIGDDFWTVAQGCCHNLIVQNSIACTDGHLTFDVDRFPSVAVGMNQNCIRLLIEIILV